MRLHLLALPLAVFAFTPALHAQEAGSATVVPVSVNGDPAARFSLVVMSDGYTAAEMPKYRAHLDKHLNVLWSIEPFRSYRNYINVYSIEIVSDQSGIRCDPDVPGSEKRVTPLGANFQGGCGNPNARGILVNQNTAREYATRATPAFDQILVITNTDTYGGIGGGVATTSGGNSLGVLITPHELGHSLGRLQDEYTYRERGVPGGPSKGGEPPSVHHTLLTEEQMRAEQKKWFRWLGDESESGGRIGRFEGGQYTTSGIWRPSRHSMMISIGYDFDQVSRERMVQRISEQVNLIAKARPTESPLAANEVVCIETAQPNFHSLDIMWQLNGRELADRGGQPCVDMNVIDVPRGDPTLTVTVVDPTPFVRDPAIRAKALTATRTWTFGRAGEGGAPPDGQISITGSTSTARPVSGGEVVYVDFTTPFSRLPNVVWSLDGTPVKTPRGSRRLHLADQALQPGTHQLTAAITDPNDGAPPITREWIIDNTMPMVQYSLSTPVETKTEADGTPHYVFDEAFTMKLEPLDDQQGYVVAEFRVNGDGWHHYYGWPDAPEGTPYKFTPRGTTIKELVYGSLSSEGLSPQPWEDRTPGYGTHRIEYRAIDAAGNIGPAKAFMVTVRPAK